MHFGVLCARRAKTRRVVSFEELTLLSLYLRFYTGSDGLNFDGSPVIPLDGISLHNFHLAGGISTHVFRCIDVLSRGISMLQGVSRQQRDLLRIRAREGSNFSEPSILCGLKPLLFV